MRSIELNVQSRKAGESPRRIRREGAVPGILYGGGGGGVTVKFDAHEFAKSGLSGHGAHLIKLRSVDGELDQRLALIQEIQGHPVSGAPIHVDFLRVDENRPVSASVAIAFVGRPKGAIDGGILQPVRRELDVRALPANLPEQIEIDVSGLDVHEAIHVEEVRLPEGVEAVYTENFTIVTVLAPTTDTKAAGEAAAEGAAPAGEGAA